MHTRLVKLLAAFGAAIGAHSAAGHHSFAAEFDADAPIDLTGTVTKVAWANPHTFFYIDVTKDNGEIENWALEMGSPNGLMRRGWTRDSMKIGDVVTVTGSRAKDGSYKGNARSVTLSTGRRLFAGSSQENAESN
jgi:hypothetical protein